MFAWRLENGDCLSHSLPLNYDERRFDEMRALNAFKLSGRRAAAIDIALQTTFVPRSQLCFLAPLETHAEHALSLFVRATNQM